MLIQECLNLYTALYVSFMNVKYNVTEGTRLNVTLVSSRIFTTNFNVSVSSSLITATCKWTYCGATKCI